MPALKDSLLNANPGVNITAITADPDWQSLFFESLCRFCKTFRWEDEKCCLPPISITVCIRTLYLLRVRAAFDCALCAHS
jgi:hypothetical protein